MALAKSRTRAWELTALEVIAHCYASRRVTLGSRRTRPAMDAAGAAILILRDRGYSFPEIKRALGWPSHGTVIRVLHVFTARLHAEDRAKHLTPRLT